MRLDEFSFVACAFVISCVLSLGTCLQCYHCNFTMSSTSNDDPCKGKAALQKCQDPAVCLSAKFSYHDPSLPVTTTTFKTCYPNLGGTECQVFLQNMRTMNSATSNTDFNESCEMCSEDGCNHVPSSPSRTPPPETTEWKSAASSVYISFAMLSLALLPMATFL